MNINREDLKKQYFKVINNIEYQPSFNYTKFENDKYIGLEITKTAEEIYRDSLKPMVHQPTETELLKQQLLETQSQLANLQEQILLNNGGIV
ncbi:hypothetical protein CNEO2_190083 [Clostridium neonatale]|uniref:hypothetical protein n=1 Tax=Clostridium neonatale TaxID=137838 RepID=UPI00291C2830|nr:hypothetical protein [Clostridium neonatale]CAI3227096.1 hypothetical protein CNEO2_190083 [Clostridium neonatale]CAI3677064.1 hypothetical protein CNEO4_520005 [Clostridium neonatale]